MPLFSPMSQGGPIPQNYYPSMPQNDQLAQLAALTQQAQQAMLGEYQSQHAAEAAQSPFYGALAQQLMAPAQAPSVQPSFNELSTPASADYHALDSALGLGMPASPMMGVGNGPSAIEVGVGEPQILSRTPMGGGSSSGAEPPVLSISGPNWVDDRPAAKPPEASLQRKPFTGSSEKGWDAATAARRPAAGGPVPRTAEELAYFQKLAPYLTQRRVAEIQGNTSRDKEATKGEYGERRSSLKAAVEMAKLHVNYMLGLEKTRAQVQAARLRAQKTGQKDEYLKALKDAWQQSRTAAAAAQGFEGKLQQSGMTDPNEWPQLAKVQKDRAQLDAEMNAYAQAYKEALAAKFPGRGPR